MKVSIITPTYNRARTLPETIDSVLSQTYDNFEYIIVDDGSTDNTPEVVTTYDNNRLEYIRLSGNNGANVARNIGVKRAGGDVIAFLDSDDLFHRNKLKVCVEELRSKSKRCGGVYHSFNIIDQNSDEKYTSRIKHQHLSLNQLLETGNAINGFSNLICKTNVFDKVGDLDEEMPAYQDYEFYMRLLDEYYLTGIDIPLTKKRTNVTEGANDRISDDLERQLEGQEKLLEKHGEKYDQEWLSGFHHTRGLLNMEDGNIAEGRKSFRKAILLNKTEPSHYYHYISSLAGKQVYEKSLSLKEFIKRQIYS